MMKYISNVSTLKLDSEKCTGCKKCIEVCLHDVFTIRKGKTLIQDLDACMECGACMRNCAFSAITVDPGVGCAAAIITGLMKGKEPTCDCSCSCG